MRDSAKAVISVQTTQAVKLASQINTKGEAVYTNC